MRTTFVPSNKVQYSPAGQKMNFSGLAVLKLPGDGRKLALFQAGEDASSNAVETSYYDVTVDLQDEGSFGSFRLQHDECQRCQGPPCHVGLFLLNVDLDATSQ